MLGLRVEAGELESQGGGLTPKLNHPWRAFNLRPVPEEKIAGEIAAIDAASRRWIGERGRKKSNPRRRSAEERRERE